MLKQAYLTVFQAINFRRILSRSRLSPYKVDLAFMVDITGSMQPWIDGVRNAIDEVMTGAAEMSELRVAFIGYRDLKDDPEFEIRQFSSDLEQFKQFLASVKATGGHKSAEDVFGALEHVPKLRWSPTSASRVLFHIADHPCHGTEFHNPGYTAGDDYPNGDPKGRSLQTLMNQLNNAFITYNFGKIRSYTDTMIEKFGQALGYTIDTYDLGICHGPIACRVLPGPLGPSVGPGVAGTLKTKTEDRIAGAVVSAINHEIDAAKERLG